MRPDWDSYFMKIAYAVSERSTCDRASVGCVLVLDKRILTKRYGQAFLDALPPCTVLRQRIGRVGELSQRWLNRDRA